MTEFSFLGDEFKVIETHLSVSGIYAFPLSVKTKKKEKSPSKLKQKSLLKSIVISKCSRNFPSQLTRTLK